MANGQEDAGATKGSVGTAQELLDTAFSKLKDLGTGEESSRLFPGGIGSVDLEIGLGSEQESGLHLSLKIAGALSSPSSEPATPAEEEDESTITFNSEGHHVIAVMAQKDLESRLPAIAQKVQQILDDGDRDIKEAATFPDDIRNQQPKTKPFHFIDIPFEDGGPVNPPLPDPPNVLSKIAEFSEFLRGGGGSAQEKVDALSWLIHLFGDAHQPLHCIDHISELHPGGDRGGNSFIVKGKAKNLHSAWDSSVNVLHPETDEDELALQLMQEHSRDSLAADLQVKDPEKWARASFNLAKKQAYSIEENPQNPPKLSTNYLQNMEKIGQRQAALAAYRLVDRLEEVLS